MSVYLSEVRSFCLEQQMKKFSSCHCTVIVGWLVGKTWYGRKQNDKRNCGLKVGSLKGIIII